MRNRPAQSLTGIARVAATCVLLLFLSGCEEEVMPRPRGYFRISLPEKTYTPYSSSCPFDMELPAYSDVVIDRNMLSPDSCRFNVVFPRFRATVYCTYLPVSGNRDELIQDAYSFAAKHEMKASALRRTLVEDEQREVYGIIYDIEGDVASQVQFFFMDSTSHFLRGSLYFNQHTNPDSIAPVLAFLREDITHIAQTLKWRKAQ